MIVSLHHFGFAVEDLEKAVQLYGSMGFEVVMRFSKDDIGAHAAMVKKGASHIELWQFDDPELPINKKIARHFAFWSDDLDSDVQKYLDNGYEISIPISKGTVVRRFAYVQDKLGNQIELLEPSEKLM